jgi:hypothetical protein
MLALVHSWRNRSGAIETDITLTERELPLAYRSNDEDSGVALELRWMDPAWSYHERERPALWLDQDHLKELGFNVSVPPSADHAVEFYQRQRARRAYVALEYDGPSWRQYLDETDRENRRRAALAQTNLLPNPASETHLIAMDASADARRLRTRHPDRSSVLIVPAVVRITVQPFLPAIQGQRSKPATLSGSVQEIPSLIHVPRPFSDLFRRLSWDRNSVKYKVHLRYGSSFEPWIAGVEFLTPPIR